VRLRMIIEQAITASNQLSLNVIRPSHAALSCWVTSTYCTLLYTLGLAHWYLGPQHLTTASVRSASNRLLHGAQISNCILVLTQDFLFALHSRQFLLTSRVVDIENSFLTETSYIKPCRFMSSFSMCQNVLTGKHMRLTAQAGLIDVLCSLQVVAATLTGSRVSIYAFEFALDTTVSAKWQLANHICWTIDELRWLGTANWHWCGRAQMQSIRIPLRGLLSAIIQSANVNISFKLAASGKAFCALNSEFIHIRMFKNHIIFNAWPNRSARRTWNLEIAVSLGFRKCSDLGAIITRVWTKKPAPNLLQISRGEMTVLDIMSAAIKYTHSQITSCAYIWSTRLLDHSIILLRKGDCAFAVVSRCGLVLSVACLPFPGIFSTIFDYSTERIIMHLYRYS